MVGVPKTIDNDLDGTVMTFGFDTAVAFATECIDRLHTTAASHRRIMVVEVMGRYAGWIALNAGIAGDADVILIPEIPYDIDRVAEAIRRAGAQRAAATRSWWSPRAPRPAGDERRSSSGAVGRGRAPGRRRRARSPPSWRRLHRQGGAHVVLGHLLRGGTPTTFDRLARAALRRRRGARARRGPVGGDGGARSARPCATCRSRKATRRMKSVPLDCDTMRHRARPRDLLRGLKGLPTGAAATRTWSRSCSS